MPFSFLVFAGMNFYDFFVFMVRFALANLYQLFRYAEGNKNPSFSLSQRVQHMVFNLKSIESIALKMKSVSLCKNQGIPSISFKEISEDHSFVEMCVALEETSIEIYGQHGVSSDVKPTSLKNYFDFPHSRICTPKDLVLLIDYALKKLAIDPDRS